MDVHSLVLLKQWAEKWGDYPYAASTLAASGCGPTCFAMIAQSYGLTITPPQIADFAIIHGFYPTPVGTSGDLFPTAGDYYGIPMKKATNPQEVLLALQQGIPCIGVHGPGEFTYQFNHFILYTYLTETQEVMVHDPNRDDTCKLYPWDFLVHDNETTGYLAFIPAPSTLSKHS